MKKSAATTFATLCSLALCLWGYQVGVWQFAAPMVLALEARVLIKPRWKISWDHFQAVHVLAAFLWLLAIFYLSPTSPSPIPYAASYHIIKCLPVGFYPLILGQTYCVNFTSNYQDLLKKIYNFNQPINLYYPYFGICLFAASVTGGNTTLFLAITAVLVAGFLGSLRSFRFSATAFYGLVVLALVVSFIGTHQFYLAEAGLKQKGSDLFNDLIQNIASISSQENNRFKDKNFDKDLVSKANKLAKDMAASGLQSGIPQPNQGAEPSENTGSVEMAQNIPQLTQSTEAAQNTKAAQNAIQATQAAESSQNIGSVSSSGTAQSGTQSTQSPGTAQSNGTSSTGTASSSGTPSASGSTSSPSTAQQGGGNGTVITAAASAQDGAPPTGTQSTQGTNSSQVASSQGADHPTASSGQPTNQSLNGAGTLRRSPRLIQQAGGLVDPKKSLTQIGNTGALEPSDTILFRVSPNTNLGKNRREPTFPLYIREAAYNQYNTGAWEAVQPQNSTPSSRPAQQRWVFGSQTPNTVSVKILTRLQRPEETLKLPIGVSEIDRLSVDSMQINQYGTVSVQGKPGEIAYTVEFDPTQPSDSAPTQLDLAIPQAEQLTLQKVIASLKLKGKSGQEAVQSVSAFFNQNFRYSLVLPAPQKNTTPLSAFLLKHRSGHCEYFASATSLLLRSAGIPTRYVVGYSVHEYSPSEQQYIVRNSNAHAWVMAYVNGSWMTIDTTPASRLLPSQNSESDSTGNSSQNSEVAKTQAGTESANVNIEKAKSQDGFAKAIKSFSEKVSQTWSTITSDFSKRPDTILWASAIIFLGLVIIFCSIFFLWRAVRKKRTRRSKWLKRSGLQAQKIPITDGLDSEFYLIENRLTEWGLERKSSETVRQWILRLKQKLPASQMSNLNQIIDLHYCYRFDPQGIEQEDRTKLRSMIQSWLVETAN
jgi:protein-glutamine gamma-glutamyltransferase